MSVIWAFDNACLMVNTPMPWRPVDARWVHKTEKGDEGAWKEGGREGWKKTGNGVEKGEERGVAEGRGTGVQHICRLPYGDTRKPSWALSLFSMADYRSILPHRKQERLPLRLPHRNSCWETATATTRIYIREGNSNFVLFTGPLRLTFWTLWNARAFFLLHRKWSRRVRFLTLKYIYIYI